MQQHIYFIDKARKYCDYAERCTQEVIEKLKQWQAPESIIAKTIQQLIDENYLNEERYVKAYFHGKLHHNKWGKNKIRYALKQKKISDDLIQKTLFEIDEESYADLLRTVLLSKTIRENDSFKRKGKLAQYAIQKGFEPALVWEILNEQEH
jgi:regulatory protein